jgi:glycine/D-amino acid oxidase-like deaminating enzyme
LSSPTSPYGGLSLWWDGLNESVVPRPSLDVDIDVDVAVVGAGFTGLWTAYSLAVADPTLRIAMVEAQVAGFGASGRNGGWCSALFAASDGRIARESGTEAALSMRRAMQDSVDEVGRSAVTEGIDCRFAKGGTVIVARNAAQVTGARAEVAEARSLGFGEDDLRWLDRAEAEKLIGVDGVLGATYSPHCAALDPARLARGLARAVEARGVTLYEKTPALAIKPGAAGTTGSGSGSGSGGSRPVVTTAGGTVRADVVVRAIEGWTPSLPGHHRRLLPVYSLMIATEPLPESFWSKAGLSERETFADGRHLIIYGQRTADGRMAFGGRGAPYHFGSTVNENYDKAPRIHSALESALVELFPALSGARITHRWGGPLGVPRDWYSSVGLDRSTGVAWSGGYVGDGVSTTNLGGRTLADLILGRDTELIHLPWVGHHSPQWEPEPLRWLGVNASLWAMKMADRSEVRKGVPSRLAARMESLLGH